MYRSRTRIQLINVYVEDDVQCTLYPMCSLHIQLIYIEDVRNDIQCRSTKMIKDADADVHFTHTHILIQREMHRVLIQNFFE